MKCRVLLIFAIVLILILTVSNVNCRRHMQRAKQKQNKQLFAESKETSPPNFVRLLVMRLLYGLATQMGFEERLGGLFNGAFVPPNADDDYLDLGGFGDEDFGLFDDI